MRGALALLRDNQLVRLFIVNTLIGFSGSAFFIGALLAFNVGGIATLIANQHAWPFVILLWFFAGLTFASVQMGVAVMNLAEHDAGGGGKRERTPAAQARLAAVRVEARS